MKKEKLTLQQKLDRRKAKLPNRFCYFLYWFIMTKIVMRKYNPHVVVKDKLPKKGACFIIWNHLSRLDHAYICKAAYPRKINIIAGYNEFFRSHLHFAFRLMRITPKMNWGTDLAGLRKMNSLIKQGACITFSPEGMSSIYGTNQPVVAGTARFLKKYRIPVYFMKMKGQYLTATKICLDERYGRTEAELSLLWTPEQLDQMSNEEIDTKLNELFRHDEYDWAKEIGIKWKHKGNELAKQLDSMLYKCPKCGHEMEMETEGNIIRCSHCGNGATANDYYQLEPLNKDCKIFESPSKWATWEREEVIKEIRKDKNFSLSFHCRLGYLPPYKYVSKKQTTEPCGDGIFSVDHEGVHFRGTKLGQPYNVDISYNTIFSPSIVTDTTRFGIYIHDEYHEFYPDNWQYVGKTLLAVEEMHRLHVNYWKNFPWNDYMYPKEK